MKKTIGRRRSSTTVAVYLGLFLALSSLRLVALPVSLAYGPENNLSLALKTIASAKKTLYVNAYELTSPVIAQALIDKITEGVLVQILNEGQPVGGYSDKAKSIRTKIVKAMADASTNDDNEFYLMHADTVKERRYRYDHAKYIIADGQRLLVGSENYSETGHADTAVKGNRGYEVMIEDREACREFQAFFDMDSDTSHGDIETMVGGERDHRALNLVSFLGNQPVDFSANPLAEPENHVRKEGKAVEADKYDVINSPETSESGLVKMIDDARESIDLELMGFNSTWGEDQSPLIDALLRAGKRKVQIRVLLNDESVFGGGDASGRPNAKTVALLNKMGKAKGYNMQARIADIKAMGVTYIHNKGALVDGKRVLISSINWNQNSLKNNRETAVLLTGESVYNYYAPIFERDWNVSN